MVSFWYRKPAFVNPKIVKEPAMSNETCDIFPKDGIRRGKGSRLRS